MTLKPMKSSRDYCLKMPALLDLPPPPPPLVPEISLPLSPSVPLILFQSRGADSPDTINQLCCGTGTAAAELCRGGGVTLLQWHKIGLVTSHYGESHSGSFPLVSARSYGGDRHKGDTVEASALCNK